MCVFVFWEVGKWEMKGESLLEASFYFIVLFSLLSLSFLFIIKARKPGITCLRVNANSCSWFLTVHALSLSPAWILSFLSLSHTFYGLYCHDDGEVKFFLKLEVDFCVCVCVRGHLWRAEPALGRTGTDWHVLTLWAVSVVLESLLLTQVGPEDLKFAFGWWKKCLLLTWLILITGFYNNSEGYYWRPGWGPGRGY